MDYTYNIFEKLYLSYGKYAQLLDNGDYLFEKYIKTQDITAGLCNETAQYQFSFVITLKDYTIRSKFVTWANSGLVTLFCIVKENNGKGDYRDFSTERFASHNTRTNDVSTELRGIEFLNSGGIEKIIDGLLLNLTGSTSVDFSLEDIESNVVYYDFIGSANQIDRLSRKSVGELSLDFGRSSGKTQEDKVVKSFYLCEYLKKMRNGGGKLNSSLKFRFSDLDTVFGIGSWTMEPSYELPRHRFKDDSFKWVLTSFNSSSTVHL